MVNFSHQSKRITMVSLAMVLLVSLVMNPAVIFAANEDVVFDNLYLSVRPEYDHPPDWFDTNVPAVLIIHIADLTNPTNEPITTLSYPAPIDEPNFHIFAVGKKPSAGQFFPAPHVLSNGQILIDLREYPIMPNEPYQLTVQYYYNPFQIDGARKSFNFEFAPEFNVKQVRADVHVPPAGRNARVEPTEFALRDVTKTDVNAENPIVLDISYDKADNIPTNRPLAQGQAGGGGATDTMFWGFVGLLGIIALVFFLVMNTKPKESTRKQKRTQVAPVKKQPMKQEIIKQEPVGNTKGKEQPVKSTIESKPKPKVKVPTASDAQKELRRKLVAGEISEERFREEMKKLSK